MFTTRKCHICYEGLNWIPEKLQFGKISSFDMLCSFGIHMTVRRDIIVQFTHASWKICIHVLFIVKVV